MQAADMRLAVYQSVQQINPKIYDIRAGFEWADFADVSEMLKEHSVAITLRFSADVVDDTHTSHTLFGGTTDYYASNQTRKMHQYRRCTLVLSIHATDAAITSAIAGNMFDDTPFDIGVTNDMRVSAADLIDAYVEALQLWAMSSLRGVVGAVEDLGVQDLSYMSDGSERRDMTLYIWYEQAIFESVPNVLDVETDISIL